MRAVWKYELPVADRFSLWMPPAAEIIHLAVQHDIPCLWALVESDDSQIEMRTFGWRGTGHNADGLRASDHVGTVFIDNGALVFHLFEILGK